ncbi:NUDIX hydrolase [Paenibacillus turpanensis]|uniref:NUDIX hydrolase n=1 Tax=Paenibacillus turpanensis TaxID=2689078 RepID=UPI00140CB35C|nr:NUDIX hydrolase [Paenibacillus turpanensis]
MQLIAKLTHPAAEGVQGRTFERRSARGVILDGDNILLLYTKRYNDYSFPGGGVEPNEDLIEGLKRELEEETGAKEIQVLQEFGYIDEYRPHHKPDYELIHMLSYYYVCRIKADFANAALEDYEVANGMSAVWINIHEALRHNQEVMRKQEASMGFSILRETLVLERIVEQLL